MLKTKNLISNKSTTSNKDQIKRKSQGSLTSMQNNRYNKNIENDKSIASGSIGERLLDSSNLVSNDEYQSPSNLLKHK